MLAALRSPGNRKRKRSEGATTPVKRVLRADAAETFAGNEALPCRALCDAVLSVSAAQKNAVEEAETLAELEELLSGPAKVGVKFMPRTKKDARTEDEKKLSGTPLFLAATLDCAKAAELLLNAGASLATPFDGVTPLEAAVKHGSRATLDLFLKRIATLETTTTMRAPRSSSSQQWTHRTANGTTERRLHRVEDGDDELSLSLHGRQATRLAASDGWDNAPEHHD